jgi:hypothetical protein
MYDGLEKYHRNIKKWYKDNKENVIAAWDSTRPTKCPVGKVGKPASLKKDRSNPDKKD